MKLRFGFNLLLLLALFSSVTAAQKGESKPVEASPEISQAPQSQHLAGWSLGVGLGSVVGVVVAVLTGSATTAGVTAGLLLLSGLLGVAALALGIFALRKKRGPRNLAIGGLISGGLVALFGIGSVVALLVGFGG